MTEFIAHKPVSRKPLTATTGMCRSGVESRGVLHKMGTGRIPDDGCFSGKLVSLGWLVSDFQRFSAAALGDRCRKPCQGLSRVGCGVDFRASGQCVN